MEAAVFRKTIIAVVGSNHAAKVSLLGRIAHLLEQEQGTHASAIDPKGLHSTLIIEAMHCRVGIVSKGNDPRHAEKDHLRDVLDRRCGVVLTPLSNAPEQHERLRALAEEKGYHVLYFHPLRCGEVPPYRMHSERTERIMDRVRDWNIDTLTRLVSMVMGHTGTAQG